MTSQIRVDEITNRSGLGTVTIYDNGFEFTGVTTFTEDVDITGGLTIGGVLTYEDVTNIDSVGVITARDGLNVTGGRVLIGTTTEGESGADDLTIATSSTTGITIRSGTSNAGNIYFSDGTSGAAEYRGQVSYLHNEDSLVFGTDGAERLRITSAGNIGIGVATPESGSKLTVNGGIFVKDYLTAATTHGGGIDYVNDGRGMRITSYGASGAKTAISFAQGNGGSGASEIARFNTSGNLVFASSGQGIDFSATANSSGTMTSELLDDYEEGAFTPTLTTNGGSGGVGGYGSRGASYTKIGRKVTCFGRLTITNKGTLSGGIAIGGLPFTIADTVSTTGIDGGGVLNYFSGVNSSHYTDFISTNAIGGSTYAVIYRGNQVGAMSGMDEGHINNNFDCRFVITYFTAS